MTAIRRTAPFLALALTLSIAGCALYDPPPAATAPAQVRPPGPVGLEDLAAQRAIWSAKGIDDYTWDVSFGCECLLNGPTTVTVVGGTPTLALSNGQPVDLATIEGFPLTIEALYDEAARTLGEGGRVTAEWAPDGLPRQLNLDRDLQAVDDELGVTINQVAPAE
jgi:hypothetical protein